MYIHHNHSLPLFVHVQPVLFHLSCNIKGKGGWGGIGNGATLSWLHNQTQRRCRVWGQIYDNLPNQLRNKGVEGQGHWQYVGMQVIGILGGFKG